jgi:hypothetical protein
MGSNTSQPAKYDTPAYGGLNTFLVLTTIAIVARGASRYLSKALFGTDDALAYVAYVHAPPIMDCDFAVTEEIGIKCY